MSARVLYMAPDLVPFPKGSGTRIEATVRALAGHGAAVTLITPAPPPHVGGARLPGVDHRLVELGGGPPLARFLAFRDGCAQVLSEGWDVAWFRSPWEGIPAVLSDSVRATVYECHGVPSIEMPSHDPTLRSDPVLLENLVAEENLVLMRASRVATPSQTGRTYLLSRGVRPERLDVVPNAVECGPRLAVPARGERLRLLYVGTLAPWQGVAGLFEALAFLRGRLDLELTLVGTRKGVWMRALRARAEGLRVRSRIRLLGARSAAELLPLMGEADVCVAPLVDDPRNSVQGCCPIKILEYMAAGRPILSTRVRPVEEILRHGETAWLVEPSSPWALAGGVLWMAEHPAEAEALGARAREEARARWHPDGFRTRIGALLSRL
jgi:glycosyltransferase involved in cell wall biosynthesis